MPAYDLRSIIRNIVVAAIAFAPAAPAGAEGSGLPVPRYVSLRASEANMRTGPGTQFPIKWVYQRAGLPLMIVDEFDHWRKVRDWQGVEGWMHSSMLANRRTVIIVGGVQAMRKEAGGSGPIVARIESPVIAKLLLCSAQGAWCQIEIDDHKGWIKRSELWGLGDGEAVE